MSFCFTYCMGFVYCHCGGRSEMYDCLADWDIRHVYCEKCNKKYTVEVVATVKEVESTEV